jgi:hypothetical protein
VILLDFVEPGQTINSERYIVMLTKLKAWISRVRPEKKITFLLRHRKARPLTSSKTVEHIANRGWTVVPHPLYSPDLVPSDFRLFGPMKDGLHGKHFLATTPSYELWNSGPPPLVQTFTSAACRLLFFAGESA